MNVFKNKHTIFLFFLFVLITLGLYFPTIESGFTTDVTSGIERISTRPFSDVVVSFGFPALNQISVFLFYVLYQFFLTNGFGWYLVYCLLHAVNAFLLFKITQRVLVMFEIDKLNQYVAVVGSLFFLISPYQSEVLVWRACQNYLLATCFIFCCILNVLKYIEQPSKKYLFSVYAFFFLSLFTFELSLLTPILIAMLIISRHFFIPKFTNLFSILKVLVLPQIIAIGGYFCLNRLVFGQWIGHYGAATHLNFKVELIISNSQKFLIKYLGFVRFFSHDFKTAIFNFIDANASIGFTILFLGMIVLMINSIKKRKKATGLIIILILLFFIGLLPVLNLYFYHLQYLENDRHGYFASAFIYIALALTFNQLPKVLGKFLIASYLMLSLYFLAPLNQSWQQSTLVFNSLIDNFKWQTSAKVIILNIPDNFRGIYMFRIINNGQEKSGFEDALKYIGGKNFDGKMLEVVQYNMMEPTDGVKVEAIAENVLKVTFNQWGNWFWRNGVGAGSGYENEYYKIDFKGHWYELEFKKDRKDFTIIYQDGAIWKQFEF